MKRKKLTREEIKEKYRDRRDAEKRGYDRDNALLEFKWTVSRGRDSYGYNICTLYVNGFKRSRCNGGGYDMQGTCLGDFIADEFADELNSKEFAAKCDVPTSNVRRDERGFYGLHYVDPCYDPGQAEIDGQTIEQREKEGKSLGLERYQAFYSATTRVPDENHFIPRIDGACGFSTVEKILKALGYELEFIKRGIFKMRKEGTNER